MCAELTELEMIAVVLALTVPFTLIGLLAFRKWLWTFTEFGDFWQRERVQYGPAPEPEPEQLPAYEHYWSYWRDLHDPTVPISVVLARCAGALPKKPMPTQHWPTVIGAGIAEALRNALLSKQIAAEVRANIKPPPPGYCSFPPAGENKEIARPTLFTFPSGRSFRNGDWLRHLTSGALGMVGHLIGQRVGVLTSESWQHWWMHYVNVAIPLKDEFWAIRRCDKHAEDHFNNQPSNSCYRITSDYGRWALEYVYCGCLTPVNFGKGEGVPAVYFGKGG